MTHPASAGLAETGLPLIRTPAELHRWQVAKVLGPHADDHASLSVSISAPIDLVARSPAQTQRTYSRPTGSGTGVRYSLGVSETRCNWRRLTRWAATLAGRTSDEYRIPVSSGNRTTFCPVDVAAEGDHCQGSTAHWTAQMSSPSE